MSTGHNTNQPVTDAPEDANAKTLERSKSAYDKARDVSYTINHALTCTAVDVLEIPLVAWLQRTFEGRKGKIPWHAVARAEIIGDVGAVPLTIAFQRHAPGLMTGLGKVTEPLFGDIFRFGAKMNANQWAQKHGYQKNGEEALEKAREIYKHETEHLGQAVMWTASSFGLNIVTQRGDEKWFQKFEQNGKKLTSFKSLAASKGIGSVTSSVALVTLRGLAPSAADKFDHWTSKKIFMPLTRHASSLAGISKKEIEDFEKEVMDQYERNETPAPHKPDRKVHEAKLGAPIIEQSQPVRA